MTIRPDFAEAYTALGIHLARQRRPADALACFRRAVELRPGLAERAHQSGQHPQGTREVRGGDGRISDRPRHGPRQRRDAAQPGEPAPESGRLDEAEKCCRRAVELRPDLAETHYNLGLVLTGQNRTGEGIACYEQALRIRPDHALSLNNLGFAHADLGDLDRAVACYRQALSLKPDFALAPQPGEHAPEAGEAGSGEGVPPASPPDRSPPRQRPRTTWGTCSRSRVASTRRSRPTPAPWPSIPDIPWAQQPRPDPVLSPGSTPARLARIHAEWDERHAIPLRPTGGRSPTPAIPIGGSASASSRPTCGSTRSASS